MAGLKTLLGIFPKTINFEEQRIQLQKEYADLQEFEKSKDLAHYKALKETVGSEEFKKTKQETLDLKYKGSEEYNKEKELEQLRKSSDIKKYHKTLVSDTLALYKKIKDSDQLKNYYELEEYVKTDEFLLLKTHYKLSAKKRFEQSDLGHTLKQYKEQSKKEEIVGYFKFVGHKLFANYEKIKDSDTLAKYEELKLEVNSHEFVSKKTSMKKAEFNASEEGQKLAEYTQLAKSKELKAYFKLDNSPLKKYYDLLHDSDELAAYDDLEKFILSQDFKEQKSAIIAKGFHDTSEYKKFRELETLKKNTELKTYFKFSKSAELANYELIAKSDKLKRLEELVAFVKTDEFIERKAYLTLKPKVRWEKSDAFAQLDEFERLDKSEKIKWYFANKDHKKFVWIRTWNITFNDEFDSGKLDKKKWLTRYYWGEEMLQDTYSLADEMHYISDGENLDLSGNHLSIITKPEKAEGKRWSTEFGFVNAQFNFTSGLINTGKSFRQKYGLFEAKIKFSDMPKLLNAFWMVGDRQAPHIDIAKANGKCSVGIKNEANVFKKSFKRSKLAIDYFIYGLEWTSDKMVWTINGQEIASTTQDIPQEEMYIALSSGVYDDITLNQPSAMEVDWIRCYERSE